MGCFSPLKGWKDAATGGITFKRAESAATRMEVACGQCLGCRLDYSRMWSMRIVHEASFLLELGRDSSFVTLTYSDDQMPQDWSLHKDHFQRFMKRLRKASAERIRFFHVGEYGSVCRHGRQADDCDFCSVGRPHYHAILFGKTFEDLEVYRTSEKRDFFTSKILQHIWGHGFVDVGDVTMQSAGYVARYCLKKVTGQNAPEWYENVDDDGVVHKMQQDYATMSRRPGIGADWLKKFSSDCFPSDEVPVPGVGVIPKVPRYYVGLFEKVDSFNESIVADMKEERKRWRFENIGEFSAERLKSKYIVKKRQIESLKREL